MEPTSNKRKIHDWKLTLLQAHRLQGRESVSNLITELAHGEARGIIACVICNKSEDPVSKNYPINVHCESLHMVDTWRHVHTSEHLRGHKYKSDAKDELPCSNKHVPANFPLGGSRFSFTFSRSYSIQEQSPC